MPESLIAALADPHAWAFVLLGFVAQLCDGALGMGFGAISTAALTALGLPREVASASVNGAKLLTGTASGAAHVWHRNVSGTLLLKLGAAGVAGGLVGALVLARYSHWLVGALASASLLLIGVYIVLRAFRAPGEHRPPRHVPLVGTAGGVTEALAGVWGPLVTSSLVALGVHPRFAVGTSCVAETFVAAAVFVTLVNHLGVSALSASVLGLLAGALLAAPLAARLLREVPRRPLMIAVGLLVIVLSLVRLVRDIAA